MFRESLEGARLARFEELVEAIGRAEGVVESPLDMAIVRDFATVEIMLDHGRRWIFEHGLITAEGWRAIKLGDQLVQELDQHSHAIPEPAISASLVSSVNILVKLKARLHERLRARKELPKEGGTSENPLVIRMWTPDAPPGGRQ